MLCFHGVVKNGFVATAVMIHDRSLWGWAVLFVWLIIDGLIFEPMGPTGILMLELGFKAVTINLLNIK